MEKPSFINSLSIRIKLNLTIAAIFIIVVCVVTAMHLKHEQEAMMELAKEQVTDLTTWYFDSLNTMMLTGTMKDCGILRKKLLARSNVTQARVIRGQPVTQQYGPGLTEKAAMDK